MRLAFLLASLACISEGCHGQPPPASLPAAVEDVERVEITSVPSPDGRAALVTVDSVSDGPARIDRVLLVAGGDTTEVFSWNLGKSLGTEWLTPDLGRVWIPIGGNYNHASVFVEPSSVRVSPSLDNDVAVDAEAEIMVTYDGGAFTLRGLWSGDSLASWTPPDLNLMEVWQECEPSVTLAGRSARLRYNCGEGERERPIAW